MAIFGRKRKFLTPLILITKRNSTPLLNSLPIRSRFTLRTHHYQTQAKNKSEFDRIQLNKDKTGVKLEGLYAIHPLTDKQEPIFI